MSGINVVIPMAGAGSRFTDAGYVKPKPFIDVDGKTMIERVLENLRYDNATYILIVRSEHMEKEGEILESIKKKYNVIYHPIDKLTEGAACTVLGAHRLINNDDPLVIANSDQIVDINFSHFIHSCLDKGLDGSILTFRDLEMNPKWSFAKVDSTGLVQYVREKEPISNIATVGIYLFTKGREFVNAAVDMVVDNERVNGEFYVCPTYNYAINNSLKIGIYDIEFSAMHGLGTPSDLQKYIKEVLK